MELLAGTANAMAHDPKAVVTYVFTLFIIFQVKQFAADFPLQNHYMLQKTRSDWKFLLPLAAHCAIHALITFIITLFFAPSLWWLGIIDFVIHFTMDRIKAGPKYLGRFSDMNSAGFWMSFGFDQMVHHFTHYWIIYTIVMYHLDKSV